MISDNDLLLYYYRDGLEPAQRERIAAALSEQPELAARLHRLVARLDAVASTPEVPVPEHVQRRWRTALGRADLDEAASVEKPRTTLFAGLHWRIAAVAAASVLLVVTLRIAMQPTPHGLDAPAFPAQTAAVVTNDRSAYERGLRVHLANTQSQLASLRQANEEERIELIEMIIAQNRLYAIAAERADEPQLARVLRAFTPILQQLADEPEDASGGELAQLNFEMRVMQARLAAATSSRALEESRAL